MDPLLRHRPRGRKPLSWPRLLIRTVPLAAAAVALAACGAGIYLTKPGATVQDYIRDQTACKAALAGAPAAAQAPAHVTALGVKLMDPGVYECMLSKGWRRA